MDTYMYKTMVSVVSLEKIEIIRSQEVMPSKVRQNFLKKMIILGPKTAILGPQFCRILVLGPHFWWSGGGPGPQGLPLDPPLNLKWKKTNASTLLGPVYVKVSFWKQCAICDWICIKPKLGSLGYSDVFGSYSKHVAFLIGFKLG